MSFKEEPLEKSYHTVHNFFWEKIDFLLNHVKIQVIYVIYLTKK